jgi:hypothetical protein
LSARVDLTQAVEHIYMAGLLSPVRFIGERKGGLTVIVAAEFYFGLSKRDVAAYCRAIQDMTQSLDDPWPAEFGWFARETDGKRQNNYEGLIADGDHRVGPYLANIDSLWGLGVTPYRPTAPIPYYAEASA